MWSFVGEVIKGLVEGTIEGIGASKEKQEQILLRIENLMRSGADAVSAARKAFTAEDALTLEAFAEAKRRLTEAMRPGPPLVPPADAFDRSDTTDPNKKKVDP